MLISVIKHIFNSPFQSQLIYGLGRPADIGIEGVIFFVGGGGKAYCERQQQYIEILLGPYIKRVRDFTKTCSKTVCHNHGRCYAKNLSDNTNANGLHDLDRYAQYLEHKRKHQQDQQNEIIQRRSWKHGKIIADYNDISDDLKLIYEKVIYMYRKTHDKSTKLYGCRCYEGYSGEYCQNMNTV